MKQNRCPVVLDVTHSLQQPNQKEGVSGGRSDLIETIAKAGIAAGFDGIFMETHPNAANAKSDSTNMLSLDKAKDLLVKLKRIHQAVGV
jgi:2-dehydro-3-deoxyphosphooctonate aldolase (KDO 8-P synthase)